MKFNFEKASNETEGNEASAEFLEKIAKLRETTHEGMKKEIQERLKNNPKPTEEELRAAAFKEWIEPQVRDAALEMNKKGYSTSSSGFYGWNNEFQAIDGYFSIDDETKKKVEALGAQVLGGAEMGLPMNKVIKQIRFYPKEADITSMKEKWDNIVAILPQREGPPAICDRADDFREEYAPEHQSFEEERKQYFDSLQ